MPFRHCFVAVATSAFIAATAPIVMIDGRAAAQDVISQADNIPEQGFLEAFVLVQQGLQYIGDGVPEDAITALESALPISRTIGDRQLESIALIARGKALVDLGNPEAALASVQDGLTIAQELEDTELIGLAEDILAELN